MYEQYWSLADKPFRNTPDPHYFYFSRQHEEALTRMLYAITEGQGAMMLTGDYGCGKTLLSRSLLDELDPDRFEVALIPYPNLSGVELLQEILLQFGYEAQGLSKVELLHLLSDCLLDNHARGCSTIIIVDEAQMVMDKMTMEEIRLLLNFQQDRKFYLTLVLMGQPELRERVEEMPQLLQRLSVRYHLRAFDEEDSEKYLAHRMAIAGGNGDIFTREAGRLIASAGEGVPRRMNNIADMSLMVGFGQRTPVVDENIVQQVITDMDA
jgi:type II secretory pathway predicted ATPase ExeA